jgi:hypothetical protein
LDAVPTVFGCGPSRRHASDRPPDHVPFDPKGGLSLSEVLKRQERLSRYDNEILHFFGQHPDIPEEILIRSWPCHPWAKELLEQDARDGILVDIPVEEDDPYGFELAELASEQEWLS